MIAYERTREYTIEVGPVLEPKFLLDVGVEAVNMFVPGTQLVRLVVEQGARRMGEARRDR